MPNLQSLRIRFIAALCLLTAVVPLRAAAQPALEAIQIGKDGRHFVRSPSGTRFNPWGFNYDRDDSGRLIEDYWEKEWSTVTNDFAEMKALGANTVRIHL